MPFFAFFFFTDLFFRPSIFYPWKGHLLGSFETKVLPLKTKTFTKPVFSVDLITDDCAVGPKGSAQSNENWPL